MRRLLSIVLTVSVLAILISSPVAAQTNTRYFSQTGHNVSGKFLDYWNKHGGLAQQGYPISDQMQEVSDVDGVSYTVQYFERAEFELHPENQPPNDVELSLLGTLRLASKYPMGNPTYADASMSGYFPQTQHTLTGRFLEYWKMHGGLAQQGYPITEPFSEVSDLDGKTYLVQYFERAVFEMHPENAAPNDVLLSQVGRFQYNVKYSNVSGGGNPPPATPVANNPPPTSVPNPPADTPVPNPPAQVMDVHAFADHLKTNYNVLGGTTLGWDDSAAVDSIGVHSIGLYVDTDTALYLLTKATKADAQAWGDSVMAAGKANWPNDQFIVALETSGYTNDPTFGDDSTCHQQDTNYTDGQGWYYTDTFVNVFNITNDSRVEVCYFVGGAK